MTRIEKQRLAMAVMSHVGDLLEFWEEKTETHQLEGIDYFEAKKVIQGWLSHLPGDSYDIRIGYKA